MSPIVLGILFFVVGSAIGAIGAYLWTERKCAARSASLQTAAALAEQRNSDLAQQLSSEKTASQTLQQKLSDSQMQLSGVQAQLEGERQKFQEQQRGLDEAIKQTFAMASAEALAKNNEAFLELAKSKFETLTTEANGSLEQRKQQIEALLAPIRLALEQHKLLVAEIEKSRIDSYGQLRQQVGALNSQTSQLVTALSRPTVRGRWGEISLRRLVELAGMTNRCDFIEQQVVDGEQGRLKPDMVVHLPQGRTVVIDCKTPLDAFLDAAAASEDTLRREHWRRHAQQVRNRAKELSTKAYWAQFDSSPEFVMLFLPGEPFLDAAAESDPALMEDCMNQKVILATPTTLIALLRTIELGWKRQTMAENAKEIRDLGCELYDRIQKFWDHFADLGRSLSKSVENYNSLLGSIEKRFMLTARKMGALGVKADKEIPELDPIDKGVVEVHASASAGEETASDHVIQ